MSVNTKQMIADRRKAQMERRLRTCRHFTGVMNDACAVGIRYAEARDEGAGSGERLPCIDTDCKKSCPKFSPRTKEEIDAEEAEFADRFKWLAIARATIVATKKDHGCIDCPRCGAKGGLRFTVARSNGHVHAGCTTKDCLRWME